MQITSLQEKDIQSIETLLLSVIKETAQKENIPNIDAFLQEEMASKKKLLNDALLENHVLKDKMTHVLVAKQGTQLIGSISCSPCNEIIIKVVGEEAREQSEIGTIYIHPDYRQQGIATVLIKAMESHLAQWKVDSYYLDSGYKSSQRVWTHLFGKAKYIADDYWGKGSHHMVWYRRL